MIRNLLLIFLFPASAAFAQTYEISVLGSTTDDSLHIQTFYSHSANRGLINVTDSRKNKPVKNFKMKTSAGKIDKEGSYYLIDPGSNSPVWLDIYKGSKSIGRRKFLVKEPPVPQIDFMTTDNKVLANGFIVNTKSPISVVFHPDSAYAALCPGDINYSATDITVVQNGNVRTPRTISGSFKLDDFGLKSGETIKLELNRYKRINYKGEAFESASPEDFLILKIL